MDREGILKNFIVSEIITNSKYKDIDADDPLIENGILDSASILKMIAFIEEEFHLTVDDSEIIPENFESIRAVVSFIISKKK